MKNTPKKLYLQVGEDCPSDIDFDTLDDVSWGKEKINSNDIEYVNAENIPLLDFFSPMVFNSVEELDKKLNELNIDMSHYDDKRVANKIREFGANQKNNARLFYVKVKDMPERELKYLTKVDGFQAVKNQENVFVSHNQNLPALFVIELLK
ncbi:MAG: hypothetical protein PHO62_07575 [Sulfurimonas sp.]|uniref:hypothetical protein n=1 Tax=Sulfurimonas sp. TaxID=2022749 RepID=UPI00261DAC96|nr:hypothetical protein [Sulfurimonas sp.]MDD5373265.1 hypothetical protein [Sulfurimonas sp.]